MVDVLNADQLEEGDLIGLGDEIVKIIDIATQPDGFSIVYENEFGEKDLASISDDEQFELFVYD